MIDFILIKGYNTKQRSINILYKQETIMDQNSVLTTQEVADMLKIAKNTVYELIKRGELNSYKVGKKVRIDLKDVMEYKERTKTASSVKIGSSLSLTPPQTYHGFTVNRNTQAPIMLCGQDIILDLITRYLETGTGHFPVLRSFEGSYNGLYSLYHGAVNLTTVHLWDPESNQYNIPYVKRLLPGIPSVLVHLVSRYQGFYVAKGNPKGIQGWEDLKREDITMINREKGSGTRILLDGHLKRLGINQSTIPGYHKESNSHLAIASTVARGGADIGLGNEKSALQVSGIDFIPLQEEQLDIVFRKEDMDRSEFRAILDIINSKEFKQELSGLGGYTLDRIGEIEVI
jgi:putative molybdopterin biosynthesis protein